MKTSADLIPLIQKKSAQIPIYIASQMAEKGLKGLSPSHAEILYYLLREGSLKMSTISNRINKDKSTVTALVNKLIRQGYVKRERSTKDSRIYFIMLTDEGERLRPVFNDISESLVAQFFKPFSKKELYTMHDLLSKIQVA
tara:strand:- start:4317 stop:4739 length:423 start_codon:yes stop_codon:yes gene_type:complete